MVRSHADEMGEITLWISGSQQNGSEPKDPDFLMFSATTRDETGRATRVLAAFITCTIRIDWVTFRSLTSRSQSRAWKADVFCRQPNPALRCKELERYRTSWKVLWLSRLLFIFSRNPSSYKRSRLHTHTHKCKMEVFDLIKHSVPQHPADLVSIDAVHFLLHGRVGLEHRKQNFNRCVQRAVVRSHRNKTENNRGSANVQETVRCAPRGERTHAWSKDAACLSVFRRLSC